MSEIKVKIVVSPEGESKASTAVAGPRGSVWYNGTVAPSNNLGVLHDYYLNTTNGDYFEKTAATTWTQRGTFNGFSGGSVAWSNITGKPSTFPPDAHTHPISDVTGLQTALDAKALASDLTAEASSRAGADTTLQSNITSEASARSTADTALQSNINTEATARASADSNEASTRAAAITALLDSVPTPGNTLQKLYNLILGSFTEVAVANIAARDAYNVTHIPTNIFVTDDGDGRWALYKATSTGVGASFVKLSDPDLLNAVMSNSQIKAAYESNADTNAFTNALLSKLNGIATGATANSTDAQLRDRSTHTGTQDAATITGSKTNSFISDFAAAVRATVLTGLDLTVNAVISATDTVLSALGKLQKQITDHKNDSGNPHSTSKSQVGLGNVDNTSDANKPVSTAQQTALNLKQDSLGFVAENVANKATDFSTINNTKFPTTKAVDDYYYSKVGRPKS